MVELVLSKEAAKGMAERLRAFLHEGGVELKQTHAYEALAQMLGYRNWNTLSGMLAVPSLSEKPKSDMVDPIAVYWPWVGRVAEGDLHENGLLRHKVETWQTPQKDGSTIFQFVLPSMLPEPAAFGLPVRRDPGDPEGYALLGIFIEGVACLLEVYARQEMEGVPETGHEISKNIVWATIHFSLPGTSTFKFVVRAPGGTGYPDSMKRLSTAAFNAVRDLRAWSAPLLEGFRVTGRSWHELEPYGEWVPYALRCARLAQPHAT